LDEHLQETAPRASAAAQPFGSGAWAELAGVWHDLGKHAKAFQDKIRSESGLEEHLEAPGRVDHSTAGALLAVERFGPQGGLPLAFIIAGHHAGLADKTDLDSRLASKHFLLAPALVGVGAGLPDPPKPVAPDFLRTAGPDKDEQKRRYELWVRMLYSTLVDADFLDTEQFHEGCSARAKPIARVPGDPLPALKERFDDYMAQKRKGATAPGAERSRVNQARDRVLEACRLKALAPQGVFSLTAPTGAGKTLAAMGFALDHALTHGLRRIIVVIPYTSIIEQNARQYREVFGPGNVVEHHASLDPSKETFRNRLACENWDALIVVTTSVQFLESLLANRSSRCRKLHNIASSVVIFDEVQTLPIGHLIPILDLLKELVRGYGVSLVLSTATQPALLKRSTGLATVFPGFDSVTEIVPELKQTFEDLRRVTIHWPPSLDEPVRWETLAKELQDRPRVLAVVHRRDDARLLARLLPGDTLHLSALMCAAHRSRVLSRIRRLLRWTQRPVRVVSTQLVEAGVDLDFPVVYRAFAGFDSVAQAAGRCNREGRLAGRGEVRVFVAPTSPPRGTPADGATVARTMLRADPALDTSSPEVFDGYFRQLYSGRNLDAHGIQRERAAWKFRTVAEIFAMIEDDGSEPIVVPYGDAPERVEGLRRLGPSRQRLRALQPYVVTLYPAQFEVLMQAGALELAGDTVHVLSRMHQHLYDERFGLVLEGPLAADPGALVLSDA
jgi:CRISPR-associated endonuclease/helicase Cas3